MRKSRKKLSIWISYSLRLFHERPIVIAVRWRAHVLWRHSLSADVHSFYRLLHQLLLHKPFLSLFCWQQNVKASLLFELFIIHSSNIKKKNYDSLIFCTLKKIQKKSWCKCIGVFRTAVCNSYNRASQAFTCTDVLTVLSYLLSYLFIICMFWLKPTLRMQMIRHPCRFPKKIIPNCI